MAKVREAYKCSSCGYVASKWTGQCPTCSMWNTLIEDDGPELEARIAFQTKKAQEGKVLTPTRVDQVLATQTNERMMSGMEEVDRVFGGGITQASVTLLAGEPGIGKSTLTMRVVSALSQTQSVLYISGEESLGQISARSLRMGVMTENVSLLQESVVENILATLTAAHPDVVVIDSIQVMYSTSLGSMAGSISQIRFVTELLVETAKNLGIVMFIIGHVTKDGNIAGPKVLEHLVDTVLVLEGDSHGDVRFLRAEKNRFGPTDEVGVFRMTGQGFEEITNPSEMFLQGRRAQASGSSLTATIEGSRSLLLEVQALATYTKFGYPKRLVTGYSQQRVELLLAVLTKFAKLGIDSYDVFVNVVGGLRVKDTSLDLSVLLAICSSRKNTPLAEHTVMLGEVGLTGEIRGVAHLEKRLKEAARQGMKEALVPSVQAARLKSQDLKIVPVATVHDAMRCAHILDA